MMLRRCLFWLLATVSCASLDQFDIPLSADGVLPGTLSAVAPGFGAWPAGADVSKQISNQGVAAADLTSVRLTKGSITVTAPATGHLMYLDSLEITVSSPGLPDVRIAHQDAAFKEKKTVYELVLDDVDLKPYVAAPSMSLKPVLKQNSRPSQDVNLRLDLTLHVDLSVIQ